MTSGVLIKDSYKNWTAILQLWSLAIQLVKKEGKEETLISSWLIVVETWSTEKYIFFSKGIARKLSADMAGWFVHTLIFT